MKNIGLFFLAALLICFACKNTNIKGSLSESIQRESNSKDLSLFTDTSNNEIIVLNGKAAELLQKSETTYNLQWKDSLLKDALIYLDRVIKKDSNFYVSYLNKSAVYRGLGQDDNAIKVLDELLHRKKYPEAIFSLGILYEKQGNQSLADKKYREAYDAYLKYLESPLSTARDEMNKDFVLLLLEGKEKTLKRINQKLKVDPGNTSLLMDKSIIEQFNREEFISSF